MKFLDLQDLMFFISSTLRKLVTFVLIAMPVLLWLDGKLIRRLLYSRMHSKRKI